MQTEHPDPAISTPNALLHVHWEGSVQLETLRRIAVRKGLPLPDDATYSFSGFEEFNAIFPRIFAPLVEEDDFYELTTAFLHDLKRQNIVYCEAFFVPLAHVRRGVPFERFFPPILDALAEGEKTTGVCVKLIYSILRAGGIAEWGDRTLDLFERNPHQRVVGIDLSGPESLDTIAPFAPVFQRARSLGLRTTAHSGEFCGPGHVRETLRVLRPDRIGHGIGAAADPRVLDELLETETVLEICPGSNLRLGAVRTPAEHPVRALFEQGIPIVIGTDDPAFFGNTLSDEYERLRNDFGFDEREIEVLKNNAFRFGCSNSRCAKV